MTAIDSIATEEKWLPSASVSLLNGSTEVNALAAHEYSQSTHVGMSFPRRENCASCLIIRNKVSPAKRRRT